MKTKDRLALVLLRAGLPDLAESARVGLYDDFDSPLATPIIRLVSDLEAQGCSDLAERAKFGEFDATKEEAAAWFEREGRDLLDGKKATVH